MKDKRGNNDLELIIEKLNIQIRFLSEQLEYAAKRIKELSDINEGHRQLNGELRKEIYDWKMKSSESEKDKNLLQGYKSVINDLTDKLRRKDS
jgi:predicted  nucleic acid-binding Zn-ribbon protein|tara:strand:+ start:109 stop:387 length:279 start_codon:yes stop_codon:yes gene_type:complete